MRWFEAKKNLKVILNVKHECEHKYEHQSENTIMNEIWKKNEI